MPKMIYTDANDPLFEDWDRASAQAGAIPCIQDVELLTLAEAAVLVPPVRVDVNAYPPVYWPNIGQKSEGCL